MFRLPRTFILSAGLALLVFGGCEWDPAREYRDLTCDSGGCFTCEQGVCEQYYCYEDHQCPAGRICTTESLCMSTEAAAQVTEVVRPCPGNIACIADEPCPVADTCASGSGGPPATEATPGAETTQPDSDPPELANSDGARAGGGDGAASGDDPVSLPDHPDDQCIVNADCGFTGICLNAGCYFPCDAIGECPPSQQCDAGQCLPTESPEVTCTFNGECGPSRVCIEGQCFATCAESLDCSGNQLCADGLCQADTSPVIQCSGSGACGADEGCFDGKCLALCDADRPCTTGGLCQYGYCHQKVTCTLTEQCTGALQCLDGDCAALSLP